MREHATPCRRATLREVKAGRHFTFNDDRLCDRCVAQHPSHRGASGMVSAAIPPAGAGLLPIAPAVLSAPPRAVPASVVADAGASLAGNYVNTSCASLAALRRVVGRVRSTAGGCAFRGSSHPKRASRLTSARILL